MQLTFRWHLGHIALSGSLRNIPFKQRQGEGQIGETKIISDVRGIHQVGGGGWVGWLPLFPVPRVEGAAVAGVGQLGLQQVGQALQRREGLQGEGGGGLQAPDLPQAFDREGTQSRGRNVPETETRQTQQSTTDETDCTHRMMLWRIIYSVLLPHSGNTVSPAPSVCSLIKPCCLFTQTGCQRSDKETINFVMNINRASLLQFKCGCLTC